MTDLVFQYPAPASTDLVFGDFHEATQSVTLSIALAGPGLAAATILLAAATVSATLAGPGLAATAEYQSRTDRPVVGTTLADWQIATAATAGAAQAHQDAARLPASVASTQGPAERVRAATVGRHQDAQHRRSSQAARHQDAQRLGAARATAGWQDGLRDRRQALVGRWQGAADVRRGASGRWQDMLRDRRRAQVGRWQDAAPVRAQRQDQMGAGAAIRLGWLGRYQDAIRPPAGHEMPPPPPPPDPCYLPSPHLVFDLGWSGSTHLVFVCERHPDVEPPTATVVVPIRSVYMTINNVTITRVDGSVPLTALNLRMAIDVDSWTWTWSATLPATELSLVEPIAGEPVDLTVSINGTAYRVIVERITRDRTFGSSRINISGRGRNARLAAPYDGVRSYSNAGGALTAQQVLADALTENAVPIGWSVDWGLDDWLVPAGAWAYQGTYMAAAQAIAGAAGGYVQPHRTDQTLRVLHRYPLAPWDWAGATPDFELPSAAVVREGIEWVDKPAYNRVFVAGQRSGILAQVTRTGTAGDVLAPMVVDPLITAVEAGRQRGRAVLSDTGRQAAVSLRLPVLALTGVIEPGALVRYVDGATTRVGLVRSTSVEAEREIVRQTIGVQTHVA